MGYNIGYGITNDGSSIYVSGTLKTKDERSDIYVAKLDTSLNIQWEKQSIGNSIKNICYGIISDNEKNVYVTGTFRDSIRFGGQTLTAIELWSTDIFIAKFSENGENMWAKGIYSYDYGFGYSIDFDHKNSIYVSGYAGENAEFSPTFITGKEGPFLAKLTKGGDYEYVK
ncbi:MAG: hypothetical protein HQ541_21280, partial [Mariniphaga sp.]|nr:hypothetical protein [Mariniphaga sp.]